MPDPAAASSSPENEPQSSTHEPLPVSLTPDGHVSNDVSPHRQTQLDLESLSTASYSSELRKLDQSIRGWISQLKEITAGCIPEVRELRRIIEISHYDGTSSYNHDSYFEQQTPLAASSRGWMQGLDVHLQRFFTFCRGVLRKVNDAVLKLKIALRLAPLNTSADLVSESDCRDNSTHPVGRPSFTLKELITNQRELLLRDLIPRGIPAQLVIEGMKLLSESQSAPLSTSLAYRSSRANLSEQETQQLEQNERDSRRKFDGWVNDISRLVRTQNISFPSIAIKERIASQAQSHRGDAKQGELKSALAAVLNHREPEQELAGQIAQALERASLRLPPIAQSSFDDRTAIPGLTEETPISGSAEELPIEQIPGWMRQIRENIANRMFFIAVDGDAKKIGAVDNFSHLTIAERHQLAVEICHELICAQAIGASPLERSALVLSLLHVCCDQELAVVDVESFARLVVNTRVPLCIDPPDNRAFNAIRSASLREVVSRNTTDAYRETLNQQHRFIRNYCEPLRTLKSGEKMTFVRKDVPTLLISWDGVGSTRAQSEIGDHIFKDLLSKETTARQYSEIIDGLLELINARVTAIDDELRHIEETTITSPPEHRRPGRLQRELTVEKNVFENFLREEHSNPLSTHERIDKLLLTLPGRSKGSLNELNNAVRALSELIQATRAEAEEEAIRVIYSITVYPLSKMLARFERTLPNYGSNFACYIVTEGDSVFFLVGGPEENTSDFMRIINEGAKGAIDEANAILKELGRSFPVMLLRPEYEFSAAEAGGIGLIVGPDNLNSLLALSGPLAAQLAKKKYSQSEQNFQANLPTPDRREPTALDLTKAYAPFLRNIQFDRFDLPKGHSSIPVVIKTYGLVSLELHQEFARALKRTSKLPPSLLEPTADRTRVSQYRMNTENLAWYTEFLSEGFRDLRADSERFESVRRRVLEAELTGRYRLVQRILSENEGIVVTQIYPGSILAMCVNKQADLRSVPNPEEFAALQHLQQADFLHFDLNLGPNRQVLAAGVYTNPQLTDAEKIGEIITPLLVISRRTEDGDLIPIQYTPGTPGYPYWAAEFLKNLGRVEKARRSTTDDLNRFIDQVVIAALLGPSSSRDEIAGSPIESQIAEMLMTSWDELRKELKTESEKAKEPIFSRAINELLTPCISRRA